MDDSSSGDTGLEEITLAELISDGIESYLLDHFHALPARVDAFDWNNGSPVVKVTPLIKRMIPDGAGNYIEESLTQLQDVPVKYYRCGKFASVFHLEKGDQGALYFADQNLGTWRATGNVSAPGDIRRHGLDGAFFAPGLFADAQTIQTDPSSAMIVGRDGAAGAQIELTDSEVHLGQGADDRVLTAKDAQALHNAIANAAVVANDGGASLKAGILSALAAAGWSPLAGVVQLGCATIKGKR